MPNDSAVTVRIPASLKRRLEARARDQHRSLSAQLLHDLTAAADRGPVRSAGGRFLGLFVGTRVPTDTEFRDVRTRMWGRLASPTRDV